MNDLLTVEEAAQALGVVRTSVYEAIREGRLAFVVLYGRKLVSRAALEEYRARTRPNGEKPRGRPRKERSLP